MITYQYNLHEAKKNAKQIEVDAVIHRCVSRSEAAKRKVFLHSPLVINAKCKLSFLLLYCFFVELSTDLSSLNGP